MPINIIAEIGINHNNSFDTCLRMIDASVEAGCDAVKIQLFSADSLYPKSAGELEWQKGSQRYSYDIYRACKGFETPLDWVPRLMQYCKEKKISFMSSVFDFEGLEFLLSHAAESIKLSSYTITNIPLIDACAEKRLPIYMSTGGASLAETEAAVNTVLKYHTKLTLMHCSLQYPTPLANCNMGILKTLRLAFNDVDLGYSDHTSDVFQAPVQSVLLGATAVEKHITLDKTMDGPDHFFALEPDELKLMVAKVRAAERNLKSGQFRIDPLIYGDTAKICHGQEQYLRDFAYMALFAKRDIKQGEIIHASDIAILRPGRKTRGLDPKFYTLFAQHDVTAKQDIEFEQPILWDCII